MGVEDSGKTRKGGGQHKDQKLVIGDVHAHGLGRPLGGVQGTKRPADTAVQRMVLFSFMISALVGAVGGVILAPITMTSYDVGIMLGLKGFAACILGGLGNPFGAAAGGVILGVLESLGAGMSSFSTPRPA